MFVRCIWRKSWRLNAKYNGKAMLYFYFVGIAGPAGAYCLPPVPPPITSEAAAMAYVQEFRLEFEAYFRDAQDWFLCVEQQKQAVSTEVEVTAQRYQRFSQDAKEWDQ